MNASEHRSEAERALATIRGTPLTTEGKLQYAQVHATLALSGYLAAIAAAGQQEDAANPPA